jgi:C4-type Zn-finger protein
MGIEHSFKESDEQVMRCPACEHLSTVKVSDEFPYVSHFAGDMGVYFVCQNPKCNVERIYNPEAVMVSGR